jgi:hypothetical protein
MARADLSAQPFFEHILNGSLNLASCIPTITPSGQGLIIVGFSMTNMGNDREPHRVYLKAFCRSRAPHSSAILPTRMLCYFKFPACRTARIEFSNPKSKLPHVNLIDFRAPLRLAFSATSSNLFVRQTLPFSFLQSSGFDQRALPFTSLPGTTPLQHHSR